MKRMFNRINEAGTMLVEAMAMLGLIAMVTPILYKKAAERTTELQDINASNQLRILANAMVLTSKTTLPVSTTAKR